MTLVTGKPNMLSPQLKGKTIVIETLVETIHTIMTSKTGTTKRQRVSRHICQVHLAVACVTCLRIECGYVVRVAVMTIERLTRSRERMAVQ